jgi:hypothetical protein
MCVLAGIVLKRIALVKNATAPNVIAVNKGRLMKFPTL